MNTQLNNSVPIGQHSPLDNALLNFLPYEEYQQLSRHLILTTIQHGEIILSSDHPLQYLYFPTTSIFSRSYIIKDGASSEVAMIGNEGLVGITQLMGGDLPSCNLVALGGGYAFRIRKTLLQAEFDKGGVLQYVLLLYMQALMTQISQTIVCNRHHTIAHQFCRWLLLYIDRLNRCELHTTHEQIAVNLGVRRESVTAIAHKLHEAGIIHCRRGMISVQDRHKLESQSCECYLVVQNEYNRLYELMSGDTPGKLLHTAAPARKASIRVL